MCRRLIPRGQWQGLLRLGNEGQQHRERRTESWSALDLDPAAMFFRDPPHDEKPESRSGHAFLGQSHAAKRLE